MIITDEAITVSGEGGGERWREEGEVETKGRRGEGRRKGGRRWRGGGIHLMCVLQVGLQV